MSDQVFLGTVFTNTDASPIAAGDVVIRDLNADNSVLHSTINGASAVVGVAQTNANSGHQVQVATILGQRVNVRVFNGAIIARGDQLVTSSTPGYAYVNNNNPPAGSVFAVALENKGSGAGTFVEALLVANSAGTTGVSTGATGSGDANWPITTTRFFVVDLDSGDDTRVGYSDTSLADALTKAVLTTDGLNAVLPSNGNGRSAVVVFKATTTVGTGTWDFDRLHNYGYFGVRTSSTFLNDASDLTRLGVTAVASGTDSGGYAVAATHLYITGATNATPILITTSANHNLVDGDVVTILNVAGNTAANGEWFVAGCSGAQFSLLSSVGTIQNGNAAYVANSGVVGGSRHVLVAGASNTTPITVTTLAHGYANGDTVHINSVGVNTGANGNWVLANVTGTTFDLVGSVGNGTYTPGTGTVCVLDKSWMRITKVGGAAASLAYHTGFIGDRVRCIGSTLDGSIGTVQFSGPNTICLSRDLSTTLSAMTSFVIESPPVSLETAILGCPSPRNFSYTGINHTLAFTVRRAAIARIAFTSAATTKIVTVSDCDQVLITNSYVDHLSTTRTVGGNRWGRYTIQRCRSVSLTDSSFYDTGGSQMTCVTTANVGAGCNYWCQANFTACGVASSISGIFTIGRFLAVQTRPMLLSSNNFGNNILLLESTRGNVWGVCSTGGTSGVTGSWCRVRGTGLNVGFDELSGTTQGLTGTVTFDFSNALGCEFTFGKSSLVAANSICSTLPPVRYPNGSFGSFDDYLVYDLRDEQGNHYQGSGKSHTGQAISMPVTANTVSKNKVVHLVSGVAVHATADTVPHSTGTVAITLSDPSTTATFVLVALDGPAWVLPTTTPALDNPLYMSEVTAGSATTTSPVGGTTQVINLGNVIRTSTISSLVCISGPFHIAVSGGGGGTETLNQAYNLGAFAADQTLSLTDATGGGFIIDASSGSFTGTSSFKVKNAAATYFAINRADGYVGINKATPEKQLHIAGVAPAFRIEDTGAAVKLDYVFDGTTLKLNNVTASTTLATFNASGGLLVGGGFSNDVTVAPVTKRYTYGSDVAVGLSASGTGQMRYNNANTQFEQSVNGGSWGAFGGALPGGTGLVQVISGAASTLTIADVSVVGRTGGGGLGAITSGVGGGFFVSNAGNTTLSFRALLAGDIPSLAATYPTLSGWTANQVIYANASGVLAQSAALKFTGGSTPPQFIITDPSPGAGQVFKVFGSSFFQPDMTMAASSGAVPQGTVFLGGTTHFTGGAATMGSLFYNVGISSVGYSADTIGTIVGNAASLVIFGGPVAQTNMSIPNSYAMWIRGDTSRNDGAWLQNNYYTLTPSNTNAVASSGATWDGFKIPTSYWSAQSGSGPIAELALVRIQAPNISSGIGALTVTTASTMIIEGAPTGGVTYGSTHALRIDSGRVKIVPTYATNTASTPVWNGLHVDAATLTLQGNTTPIAELATVRFSAGTITSASTVTTTVASTLLIEGPPVIAASALIGTALSLWVKTGNTSLNGNLTTTGTLRFDGLGSTGLMKNTNSSTVSIAVAADIPDLSAYYVPLTRTLIPGSGVLIDGGSSTLALSANRTLAVDTTVIATRAYALSIAGGLHPKTAVDLATTVSINSGGAPSGEQTIDTILTSSSRVLVKNQSSQINNGIYVTNAGAWTRAADETAGASAAGDYCFVSNGTANINTSWVCNTPAGSDVLGTSTTINFVQFSSAGSVVAGAGMTQSGNTLNVIANADNSITVNANDIQVATHGITYGKLQQITGGVSVLGVTAASTGDVAPITASAIKQFLSSDASGSVTGITFRTIATTDLPSLTATYISTATTLGTTSPITGGGTISTGLTLAIASHGITPALFQQSAAYTIHGNLTGSTADVASVGPGFKSQVLAADAGSSGSAAASLSFRALVATDLTGALTGTYGPVGSFYFTKTSDSTLTNEIAFDSIFSGGAGLVKVATDGTPSKALAGTDYENALTFSTGLTRVTNTITNNLSPIKFIVQTTADLATVTNGQALGALSTGILKSTTTTGVVSIASGGTDYEFPLTFSGGVTRSTNAISLTTNGVSNAILRQSVGFSVVGKLDTGTGNVADITAASDHSALIREGNLTWATSTSGQYLRNSGGTLGFGAIVAGDISTALGTISIIAGNGLTGGGTLAANRTLTVLHDTTGGDTSIVVASTGIMVGTITDTQHGNRGGGSLHALAINGGAAGFLSGTDKLKLDNLTDQHKASVVTVSTTNIVLSGTATVDGIAVVTGNRILVAGQSAVLTNGIYIANTAGAWTRASDFDTSSEMLDATLITVEKGTVYHDTIWMVTTDNPITMGFTGLVFSQVGGLGATSGPPAIGPSQVTGASSQWARADHVHQGVFTVNGAAGTVVVSTSSIGALPNTRTLSVSGGGLSISAGGLLDSNPTITLANATTSVDGSMSAADKTRFNNMQGQTANQIIFGTATPGYTSSANLLFDPSARTLTITSAKTGNASTLIISANVASGTPLIALQSLSNITVATFGSDVNGATTIAAVGASSYIQLAPNGNGFFIFDAKGVANFNASASPAVSNASSGALQYNSTKNRFEQSQNGSAYVPAFRTTYDWSADAFLFLNSELTDALSSDSVTAAGFAADSVNTLLTNAVFTSTTMGVAVRPHAVPINTNRVTMKFAARCEVAPANSSVNTLRLGIYSRKLTGSGAWSAWTKDATLHFLDCVFALNTTTQFFSIELPYANLGSVAPGNYVQYAFNRRTTGNTLAVVPNLQNVTLEYA